MGQTMKTLGIFACLLAVVFAAENTVADEKSSKSAEPVDQLTEEQRYGGYRGGYRGGYGGRRYGRSVADETQELEGQEQRYGGYRGGYRGGYGGRRYGRSITDETQELEGQEQRYGGYGGYR